MELSTLNKELEILMVSGVEGAGPKNGLWDSLADTALPALESIMGSMSQLLSSITEGVAGLSAALAALKQRADALPSRLWAGVSLPVPRVSTGTVLPTNRQFLEAVSRESGGGGGLDYNSLAQAIAQALRQAGREDSGQVQAVMEVDGQAFGQLVYKHNKQQSRRVGVSLREV